MASDRNDRADRAASDRPGPKPVFEVALSVHFNALMGEQFVDFCAAVAASNKSGATNIAFPPQLWALYRQIENWVGEAN